MNRRWSVPVAGLLLALTACSHSDSQPRTLPPVTTSPTASAAPSVPPFPATRQGAADFVRLWVETLNRSGKTGDTTALEALSDPSCQSCTGLIALIHAGWSNGGHLEGGEVTLSELVPADTTPTSADVTANFHFAEERRVNAAGKVIHREPASVEGEEIRLVRQASGWLMRAVTQLR